MEEEIESGRKKKMWSRKFTPWQTDCHIGEGGASQGRLVLRRNDCVAAASLVEGGIT